MSIADYQPLVTVVIVCYKHAEYIADSIISVVKQTYPSIQLIVIDDESPDESRSIISKLAEQYYFETFFPKNAGLTAALNKGMALAQGKYFVYLGADDKMFLDRIEKQVTFMESHDEYAVCAGNVLLINEHGETRKKQSHVTGGELTFDDIFLHRKEGVRAPTALIRTDILKAVGGYNAAVALEDIYMWLKITSKGHRIYVMDDELTYYRKHDSNQSKNVIFMADAIEQIYSDYQSHPQYQRMINTLLINLFLKAAKRNYPGALSILKRVKLPYYNMKVVLGLCYLLGRWISKR